jgi:hypothetical protein
LYRMVQVAIVYATLYRDPAALEPTMTSLSADWVRMGQGAWLLWTNRSVLQITQTLKAVLQQDDQYFVSAMHPHEPPGGVLSPWIRAWINSPRDPVHGGPPFDVGNTNRPMTGGAGSPFGLKPPLDLEGLGSGAPATPVGGGGGLFGFGHPGRKKP